MARSASSKSGSSGSSSGSGSSSSGSSSRSSGSSSGTSSRSSKSPARRSPARDPSPQTKPNGAPASHRDSPDLPPPPKPAVTAPRSGDVKVVEKLVPSSAAEPMKVDKPEGADKAGGRAGSPLPARLSVGALTRNVTNEHVREIFSNFGKVKSAEVSMDRTVNLSRGFAYVEFETRAEAEDAKLHMDGGQLDGNFITVNFVLLPRKHSPPPSRARAPLVRDDARAGKDGRDGKLDRDPRARERDPRDRDHRDRGPDYDRRPPRGYSPPRRGRLSPGPPRRRDYGGRLPSPPRSRRPPSPPRRRGLSPPRYRRSPPRRGRRSPSPPRRPREGPRETVRRRTRSPAARRGRTPPPAKKKPARKRSVSSESYSSASSSSASGSSRSGSGSPSSHS